MDVVFPTHTVTVRPMRTFAVPTKHSFNPTPPIDTSLSSIGGSHSVRVSLRSPSAAAALLRRRMEYGTAASDDWRTAAGQTADLAGRSRRLALLQSALTNLCHIAAMDKSGHFLRPRQGWINLTDIYTTVRALRLEYEDLLRLADSRKGVHKNNESHSSNSMNANSGLENSTTSTHVSQGSEKDPAAEGLAVLAATEERIDACLPLLEPTLLRMLLQRDAGGRVPVMYALEILRALPQVFAVEGWPCTVLRREDGRRQQTQSPQPPTRPRRYSCEDAGHMATAIVLKTLRSIEHRDAMGLLSKHSSISVTNSAGRSALDVGPSFDEIMRCAWSGVYGVYGLYGVLYDMRAMLCKLHGTARTATEAQAFDTMTTEFEQTLRYNYANLLRRAGIPLEPGKALLPDETMFDIIPLVVTSNGGDDDGIVERGEGGVAYTETQRKCLRLLDLLRAVDTKKWFEFPVFDMANLELSSVERWIRSAAFGTKTDRGSFMALCEVLEQMVDNCVMTYGPNSPYSQVITKVRQHLVDASREVRLL